MADKPVVEMILGVAQDPALGLHVVLGAGGGQTCTITHHRQCQRYLRRLLRHRRRGLQPPPNVLRTAVHKFTPRDAGTATLEAMVE